MRTFIADKNAKLSKYLLAAYDGGLSFSALNKLFRKRDVKVNGVRTAKDIQIYRGDKIEVYYDGEKPDVRFKLLFEDDNVYIVAKPKGVTSEETFLSLSGKVSPLYFCHRLDRNTDGVMIFAKSERAFEEIKRAFKERTFEKYYRAVVYGAFGKEKDVLNAYLKKDAERGVVKVSDKYTEGALPIKTGYRVIFYDKSKNASLIEVTLFTGRTHQIRAHLASVGHFVIGDGKYGDERINRALKAKTLMLTSSKTVLHFCEGDALYYLDGKFFEFENELINEFIYAG